MHTRYEPSYPDSIEVVRGRKKVSLLPPYVEIRKYGVDSVVGSHC